MMRADDAGASDARSAGLGRGGDTSRLAPSEPGRLTEAQHSWDCGCWICDGREPDGQSLEPAPYGRCMHCGTPLEDDETIIHPTCIGPFMLAL